MAAGLASPLAPALSPAANAALASKNPNAISNAVAGRAAKAKTATRRVVALSDAARAWLAPYARSEGPVSPVNGENRLHDAVAAALRRCRAARKVKVPFVWKRNGLRHAFCSYRLSVTQNLNLVALEAGNSPTMIHGHYKELVPAADALAWFNTLPPEDLGSGKVIPLPALAA